MPAWLRRLQQSKIVQLIVIPTLITTVPALYQCAGNDFANLSIDCFKKWAIAAVGYAFVVLQHSPGSASFNPNGTPNEQVAEVVKADAENKPVAVVPVPTAQAREDIRAVIAIAKMDDKPLAVAVNTVKVVAQ